MFVWFCYFFFFLFILFKFHRSPRSTLILFRSRTLASTVILSFSLGSTVAIKLFRFNDSVTKRQAKSTSVLVGHASRATSLFFTLRFNSVYVWSRVINPLFSLASATIFIPSFIQKGARVKSIEKNKGWWHLRVTRSVNQFVHEIRETIWRFFHDSFHLLFAFIQTYVHAAVVFITQAGAVIINNDYCNCTKYRKNCIKSYRVRK